MTRLSNASLTQLDAKVATPNYDRTAVSAGIVHFGVGGFHRAHQAMYLDELMNQGKALDWGIVGVGVMPGDRRMQEALASQDHLYTVVLKHPDGNYEPRVVGSIIDYRFAQHHNAKTGMHGMGRDRHGAAGDDIVLRVPVGTQVIDAETDEILIDMVDDGQRALLAKGGNGGWGNTRFKSSTNQAPRTANPGEDGEEKWIWLRLKLIADSGLIGLPNAGKSTFLSTVSSAKPKTADYPFTTLHPHLGVVSMGVGERFVIADLPGLIEGAAEGAGLGHKFLGHAERCAAIVHLVDGTAKDPVKDYTNIRNELLTYDNDFADKPEILALSKCDSMTPERIEEWQAKLEEASGN